MDREVMMCCKGLWIRKGENKRRLWVGWQGGVLTRCVGEAGGAWVTMKGCRWVTTGRGRTEAVTLSA